LTAAGELIFPEGKVLQIGQAAQLAWYAAGELVAVESYIYYLPARAADTMPTTRDI
jgi:hypothetical protein